MSSTNQSPYYNFYHFEGAQRLRYLFVNIQISPYGRNDISKLLIQYIFLVFVATIIFSCSNTEEQPKPNIILIMADDLGYTELGCYGQKIIRTPNIDRLAEEGMRFTQFYSGSPVCAPSRCVLLTGLHSGHAYVRDNYELGGFRDEEEGGQLPLPEGTQNIGSILKENGYVTSIIGKWGLGGPESTGVPNKQGFDYFYGYLCQKQAHNYYPTHLWENEQWDTLDNEFFMPHQKLDGDPDDTKSYEKYSGNEYAQDKMIKKALAFLEKNKDTSFFLYLPFTVPHLALQVPEDEPSLDDYKEIIPDSPYVGNKGYLPHTYPRAAYAAMITRMDREIGKIIQFLKSNDLDENTVVLFTSDNGPTYNRIGGSDSEFFDSNKPFSGLKGSVHEGGIRVPLVVWWPGKIKPNSVSDHLGAFQDFLPTIADLVDTDYQGSVDGLSLYPTLIGQDGQENHSHLYWEFPSYGGQVAVRMGNWKAIGKGLLKNPDNPLELFNLKNDIAEQKNVADENPEIIRQIIELIKSSRTPSGFFPFPALESLSYVEN